MTHWAQAPYAPKIMKQKSLVVLTLVSFFTAQLSFANTAEKKLPVGLEESPEARASEFVMRRFPGERLMPVRIVGGVKSPGTYYVPEGTDLLTILSLSGGLQQNTDSEEIQLSQWQTKKTQTIDLERALSNPVKFNPTLAANDVLFIPEKEPLISANTLTALTVVATVVSVITAGFYIRNETKK